MSPLVSVLLPVYNQQKYIAATIESILAQTFSDFELLILDDGSTDSSADIIKEYASKDKRIIPFFQKNAGKCEATNRLAEKAKGEFLALIDADDIMLPHRLERQVNFHKENPEADASSCHCHYINEKGIMLGTQYFEGLKSVEECKQSLKENKVIHCAFTGMMLSKKAYIKTGGLRSPFWPVEDLDFANRLVEQGHALVIIQEPLMKYRLHSSSVTTSNPLNSLEKSDWAMHCMILRRENKPEISYEAYKQLTFSQPWLKRLNRKRSHYSNIYFRQAGIQLMSKKYLHFLYQVSLASLLSPAYVLRKVKNLVKNKV